MARNPKPRQPALRQRVTWESADLGKVEESHGAAWAFNLGYSGEPEDVANRRVLHRAYQAGREVRQREPYAAHPRVDHEVDPNAVERETVYTLNRDFPEFQLKADDLLIVRPDKGPVIRRPVTPALAFALRDHLRVCYADEADPAPDLHTPAPIQHLTLMR